MKSLKPIYFDHQASTPINPQVLEVMLPYWTESFGNPHSSEHAIGWAANKAIEKARGQIANLIGSDKSEIIFTSGATEANNIAILGTCTKFSLEKGRDTILVSSIEHKCVLEAAKAASEKDGFRLEIIPVDEFGYVDMEFLSKHLSERVMLVSIAAVNNEIGTIQNIKKISSLCRKHGVIFHTDCAQAPCAIKMGNIAEYADAASISGHKFGGPMGVGALYLSQELQNKVQPLFNGGGQEYGLRSGTLPLPLCVGLGAAAKIAASPSYKETLNLTAKNRDYFLDLLMDSSVDVNLSGPSREHRHPGNANLELVGYDAQDILMRVQPALCASSGSACSTGAVEPSHVLKAIGLSNDQAASSIRFSFSSSHPLEEIQAGVELLINILQEAL